jgi:hypothetical protein
MTMPAVGAPTSPRFNITQTTASDLRANSSTTGSHPDAAKLATYVSAKIPGVTLTADDIVKLSEIKIDDDDSDSQTVLDILLDGVSLVKDVSDDKVFTPEALSFIGFQLKEFQKYSNESNYIQHFKGIINLKVVNNNQVAWTTEDQSTQAIYTHENIEALQNLIVKDNLEIETVDDFESANSMDIPSLLANENLMNDVFANTSIPENAREDILYTLFNFNIIGSEPIQYPGSSEEVKELLGENPKQIIQTLLRSFELSKLLNRIDNKATFDKYVLTFLNATEFETVSNSAEAACEDIANTRFKENNISQETFSDLAKQFETDISLPITSGELELDTDSNNVQLKYPNKILAEISKDIWDNFVQAINDKEDKKLWFLNFLQLMPKEGEQTEQATVDQPPTTNPQLPTTNHLQPLVNSLKNLNYTDILAIDKLPTDLLTSEINQQYLKGLTPQEYQITNSLKFTVEEDSNAPSSAPSRTYSITIGNNKITLTEQEAIDALKEIANKIKELHAEKAEGRLFDESNVLLQGLMFTEELVFDNIDKDNNTLTVNGKEITFDDSNHTVTLPSESNGGEPIAFYLTKDKYSEIRTKMFLESAKLQIRGDNTLPSPFDFSGNNKEAIITHLQNLDIALEEDSNSITIKVDGNDVNMTITAEQFEALLVSANEHYKAVDKITRFENKDIEIRKVFENFSLPIDNLTGELQGVLYLKHDNNPPDTYIEYLVQKAIITPKQALNILLVDISEAQKNGRDKQSEELMKILERMLELEPTHLKDRSGLYHLNDLDTKVRELIANSTFSSYISKISKIFIDNNEFTEGENYTEILSKLFPAQQAGPTN